MLKTRVVAVLLTLALSPVAALSQVKVDADINARIRKEGMDNSQIMKTMHYFTDVYGPRLTGSPNHKAAAEWAVKQMTAWGMDNAHLEPWDFGHPGWANERLTAHAISPFKDALVCEVLSWTPSTKGTVTAQALHLILPDRPTQEDLNAFFTKEKANVKGKIVFVGKPATLAVNITPPAKRIDDQQAKSRFDPNNPNAGQFPGRPGNQRNQQQQQQQQGPTPVSPAQIAEQLDKFLLDNGAAVRVNDAGREHGQIRAFQNRTYDVTKAVPTVVMRNEDFGRVTRVLAGGTPVTLEFNIVNRIYPEGKTSYNTVGEITGTDKKDEVIMLGGHLDSWHAATGATDNAIGCAIMMEAARILKTLGVKPRRTIRVALWSGEEQGLLGSQAYVKQHFGSFEEQKPGYEKFGGYFNIDSGTGRIRGASVFGPPETASVLRDILAPFDDFGVAGSIATRSRATGGSDHTSFNQAGLPGIGLNQDPIEYNSHTWHTNLDTYERIIEDDVKKAAVVVASAVYHLAMRDELLPRFAKEAMPQLPPARPQPTTPAPPTTPPGRSGNQ